MSRTVHAYAPGRTELAGNHTDHQGGRAVAATVNCGIRMSVSENGGMLARVASDGFGSVEVNLADLSPVATERLTTAALVRGVLAGLRDLGVEVKGIDVHVESDIPAGGGLSSSAAFELALGQALNVMFAGGALSPERLAVVGQDAERGWFGKPCGLMDQLSIALGGIRVLDFSESIIDGKPPRCETIEFDFAEAGYAMCLIDTHCDHSAYSDEYAQVTHDMDAVAHFLGARALSQVPEQDFFARFAQVRASLGDLCALRGLHYYREMALVGAREKALRSGDITAFLEATRRSGASSAQYLQNVSTMDRMSQPAMVALAVVDHVLGKRGACRIHGGGFGGTVAAFVPVDDVDRVIEAVDGLMGAGSCRPYGISPKGAYATWA